MKSERSPTDTKVALRLTWHFGTVALTFLGAWLLATGLRPRADFAVGVTYLSGTLLSFLALAGRTIPSVIKPVRAPARHVHTGSGGSTKETPWPAPAAPPRGRARSGPRPRT